MYWENEGNKFQVPFFHFDQARNRKVIQHAKFAEQANTFDKSFMIRSRLNADLDYLDGVTKFGKLTNSKPARIKRIKKLKKTVEPFGLKLTRLSEERELASNEPFIIHRIDTDITELLSLNNASINSEKNTNPKVLIDERFKDWNSMLKGLFNPFGHALRSKQLETITRLLERPGGLTIAALPTGYGKTRIAQYATYLIRKTKDHPDWSNKSGDTGPTLIISPLVALMDDQRTKWNEDFGQVLTNAGLDPLVCTFLTSADLERDPSKMEKLRNDEIDVFCCSPEDLIDPKLRRNHWLETFARMKVPFSMMVVDEAHIIGSWGSTIRPQFQLLNLVKNRLLQRNPMLRVLLMSATISLEEEVELIRLFSENLHHEPMVDGKSSAIRTEQSATRPELYFDIRYDTGLKFDKSTSKEEMENLRKQKNIERANLLIDKLANVSSSLDSRWNLKADGTKFRQDGRPSPILIYTPYPDIAEKFLKPIAVDKIGYGQSKSVTTYTGKTGPTLRLSRLNKFVENDISAMIATSAFGMGVDKPDLWAVGYYGMPFSLSDLYQGFGRAARNHDWDKRYNEKSGYCFGLIFGNVRSFKPNMQIALTTERLCNMLAQNGTYFTDNGYLVIDIAEGVEDNVWETNVSDGVMVTDESSNADDDDEGNDGQTYDIVQELSKRVSIANNSSKSVKDNFDKLYKENLARLRSIKEKFSLRVWALACLQRSSAIEVMGFHPSILFNDGTEQILLNKELSKPLGYSEVMKQLSRQGECQYLTPTNADGSRQNRMLVVKINQDISDFTKLKQKVKRGLKILESRHNDGSNKLSEFIELAKKSTGGCFRQKFSPVVGIPEGVEKTCIGQIKENIRLNSNKLVMPCSICRKDESISSKIAIDETMILTDQIRSALSNPGRGFVQEKQTSELLVIKKFERLSDCENNNRYDARKLAGSYKYRINSDLKETEVDICDDEGGKIGSISLGKSATIKSNDVWGRNSYIVLEKGNSASHLRD